MAELSIPTQSWITVDDADLYFKYRIGADGWKNATKDVKEAALVTAKKQITGCFVGMPNFPSSHAVTAMEDAQCEQALFLVDQNGDQDRRAALQAQGVIAAGVVKEQYDPKMAGKVAFAPAVLALLGQYYQSSTGGIYGAKLKRDELA